MIEKEILDGIKGEGPLQAEIPIRPLEQIRLRPNVIFDIVYNKKVLHLGCTDHMSVIDYKLENGIYLHQQLSRVSSECVGIDINSETTEYLSKRGITNIIVQDITQPGIDTILDNQWDYLLMAEVLEHIDNPVAFLKDIATLYKSNIHSVIITVPNALGYISVVEALNNGRESINNDHRYWFTPFTLCKVAYQAGLILDELIMCVYENSSQAAHANRTLLKNKPLLMDTILLVAHW